MNRLKKEKCMLTDKARELLHWGFLLSFNTTSNAVGCYLPDKKSGTIPEILLWEAETKEGVITKIKLPKSIDGNLCGEISDAFSLLKRLNSFLVSDERAFLALKVVLTNDLFTVVD